MPKLGTVLIVLAVAAAGFFGWAYLQSKKPGSSGGVWGTVKGLFSGANSLTQGVTDASGQLGSKALSGAEAVGGAVGSGVRGTGSALSSVATNTRHVLTLGIW